MMNERIQELAKQTGYIWHASGDPQIYEFTPEKLDRFAELIVRECSRIADGWVDNDDDGKNYPSKKIKEYFGVEK